MRAVRLQRLALFALSGIVLSGPVQASVMPPSSPEQDEATRFYQQLAAESHNSIIAAMARENLARLQQQTPMAPRTVEVPLLTRQNRSLAVPVVVNRGTMATFLIDTGASHTVITPRMAHKLGVVVTPETPRMTIITANGTVRCPVVMLDDVTIGGVTVHHLQAVIQPLGNDLLLAGLLGMNFFQNMDLTVRQNRLILSVR